MIIKLKLLALAMVMFSYFTLYSQNTENEKKEKQDNTESITSKGKKVGSFLEVSILTDDSEFSHIWVNASGGIVLPISKFVTFGFGSGLWMIYDISVPLLSDIKVLTEGKKTCASFGVRLGYLLDPVNDWDKISGFAQPYVGVRFKRHSKYPLEFSVSLLNVENNGSRSWFPGIQFGIPF